MIPEWNNFGVLPPIRPSMLGHSKERSPYRVNINDVIETFGFSEKRRLILKGLLSYRMSLYKLGISKGFQWLDGSFVEDVETFENRSPNDLDVVTFFHLPYGIDQEQLYQKNETLFNPEEIKKIYKIDGYICLLGQSMEKRHVREISYWYSVWSHRRNGLWKGFIQIDLSQHEDQLATQTLYLEDNNESR